MVNLEALVCGIVRDLEQQAPHLNFVCAVEGIEINADLAIPIGLLITELVTNAIKYAYPEGQHGAVEVAIARRAASIVATVSDGGRGLPEDFDQSSLARTSLGMRMIASLTRQLHAEIGFADGSPGTMVTLTMPDPGRAPAS
jgi:two-component sensor histidine kinase